MNNIGSKSFSDSFLGEMGMRGQYYYNHHNNNKKVQGSNMSK